MFRETETPGRVTVAAGRLNTTSDSQIVTFCWWESLAIMIGIWLWIFTSILTSPTMSKEIIFVHYLNWFCLTVFTGMTRRQTAGRLWPRCQWRDWGPAWSCVGGVCTWWGGSTGTTGGTRWSAINPTPTPGSTWHL